MDIYGNGIYLENFGASEVSHMVSQVSTPLLSSSVRRLLLLRPLPIKLMAGGSMGPGDFFAN